MLCQKLKQDIQMIPVHIIGHAECGKTTAIVEIIEELIKQDYTVGSIKHSAHVHELDKPGKDSFLHRQAGAAPVSMVTEKMTAIYLPQKMKPTPQMLLDTYYKEVDFVLIEGWISGPHKKIELWRSKVERKPLFHTIENVVAFVTDDNAQKEDISAAQSKGIPQLTRSDLIGMVDFIVRLEK